MPQKSKKEWIEFSWPGAYLIQCLPPFRAWAIDFIRHGLKFSKMAVTFANNTSGYYFIKQEYEKFGRIFFEQVVKNPNTILKYLNQVNQTADRIFKFEKPWSALNFKNKTDRQLIAYHKAIFTLDEKLWRDGQWQNLLEMHNSFVTDFVRKNLKAFYGQSKELEYFQIISTSRYATITERQDINLIKLALKIKKVQNLSKNIRQIKSHWLKYRWMTYGWTGPEISLAAFRENLKEILARPKVLHEIQLRLELKKQTLQKQLQLLNKFPLELKKMSLLLRALIEAKAKRVDAHSLTYFLADPLLKEFSRRLGLSLNQLRVIDPLRVRTLFKGKSVDEINEELKMVVYWFELKQGLKKFTGNKARSLMKEISANLPKIKMSATITGALAYAGKVRGVVRVILSARDIGSFKKGEILVSGMTDPGFVPALKKAKAVITDMGGITCHAAIISREFRIPCIIGTRIATKVLKDGDKVEVDANKGIIRKL